jgi:ADP-ribose pyrophosphatase YjhB (NUDIX family)
MAHHSRNESDVPNLSSGSVIYDKDDNLLLVLQKNDIWSLPKGSLKYNESIYEGALRETLEETKIDLSKYEPIAVEEYILHGEQRYYLFIYKLNASHDDLTSKKPSKLNSKKIEWVTRDDWKEIIHKHLNMYKDKKINFLTLSYLNSKYQKRHTKMKRISRRNKIKLNAYKTIKVMRGGRKSMKNDFCRCIKKVRKTVKVRPGQNKTLKGRESAAIGICVKSVIQTRGRTLKKFKCTPKPYLLTQKSKN